MSQQYFIPLYENINENNFILFKEINMIIGTNIDLFTFDLFYFQNNSRHNTSVYSNISIYGINTTNSLVCNPINIATFYKNSNTNFGIEELLNNITYISNMKLKVIFTHQISSSRYNMKIYIYIQKDFLLSLYLQSKLPRFLFKIIEDTPQSNGFISYNNIINNDIPILTNLNKNYKRELFQYQINNINKMKIIENNIFNKTNILKLSVLKQDIRYYIYYLDKINDNIVSDSEQNIINEDILDNVELNINGGILCDNVGLGKTATSIGLISEKLSNNETTLLICPTRLCKQWTEEIDKTYDLKYKIISNIRQFKKLSVADYCHYDIIIIHYNFLNNKNYISFMNENPYDPILIHNYNWHRLILDESHEFIKKCVKKNDIYISNYLFTIKSKIKWLISATPYSNINDLNIVINFIINSNDFNINYFKHKNSLIYNSLFIKNNSINIEVNIPEPTIETIFLDMSSIERNIYDSALDDNNKKFELCNHIMVSEQHLSILGNTPQTLEEIHLKMTEYLKKKINYLEKRIININTELNTNYTDNALVDELNAKKNDIIQDLKIFKSKFNIFNNIENTIIETEECPICFENLDTLTRTLTPCGHSYCSNCIKNIKKTSNTNSIKCSLCRHTFNISELSIIKKNDSTTSNKQIMGTKISYLLELVKSIINSSEDKIIIFSQFDTFIKLISKIFDQNNINNLFINGSINNINSKIRKFKLDNSYNIVFISSDKSPSGLNLQEASHIILLDTVNTTTEHAISIEKQAIGRAVRIGQTKSVSVKRLIMRNTIEHDMYIKMIS